MIWAWDWKQLQYWFDTEDKKTLLKQTFRIPVEEKKIKKLKKFIPKDETPQIVEPKWYEKGGALDNPEFWDQVGRAMTTTGLGLLNPVGPEDLISPTPVDEIIGFTLIFGGVMFQLAY